MNKDRRKAYTELEEHGNEADGFCGAPIMNRKQRRRARKQWADGIMAVHREAQGVLEIEVIDARDILLHPRMFEMLTALAQWATKLRSGWRPLCLLCDHEWSASKTPPPAFVFVRPWQQNARRCIVNAICEDCARRPRLYELCNDAYRHIWPDLRSVPHVHEPPAGVS